jgi:adenylyltransferase/sulfurtransferase
MTGDPGGQPPTDLTPRELRALLDRRAPVVLLDVREPHEHAYARIPGARLVPLATLVAAIPSLDPDAETVVYCHHGMRSAHAVELLREAGFARVRNLTGGIDRWSTDVDSSVPRY